ncbi:MAG TPA: dynamin family protein, partial [Burkholderiaceae bacterium]|nr:dynamin family protein [Burkholderiaceae bacterium]
SADIAESLRQRVLADKLVVAFVAEFSRGKSELINAIFFADTGRRILPATPGRTTMCPVELGWDAAGPPSLDLLAIETRRDPLPLSEWRQERSRWKRVPLDPADPAALAQALAEVTQTLRVTPDTARELGLWSDTDTEDNPPLDAEGQVEVPAWRHAVINYPHPLLERGLVVLDTPGLNAIGTEPELTLGLLPGAHAALFLLGADAGVTKSDLAVWNEHLGGQSMACFVVLNKIDALDDPLLSPAQVEEAVQRQCLVTAQTLGMPRERVFPVSARQALHARLVGDEVGLARSRLPALERALVDELLPARQEVLTHALVAGVDVLREQVGGRLRDERRQTSEQLLELRGLRGKSNARVRHLIDRVEEDSAEFERCVTRLTALRAVQARLARDTQAQLSAERIRTEVQALQKALDSGLLHLGARQAFLGMCGKLRGALADAEVSTTEARDMLQGTFRQLNAEFGFSLSIAPPPEVEQQRDELSAIERGYNRYFGLSETLRMASATFKERFVRMLVSKLRVAFETAARDIELWHQSASAQMEAQLRDRRRSFRKRRESLDRIQQAAGELEERVADLEGQSTRVEALSEEVQRRCETLAWLARRGPQGITESEHFELPIELVAAG